MNNVVVLDNPSPFYNPFQFEITFECIEDLSEGEYVFPRYGFCNPGLFVPGDLRLKLCTGLLLQSNSFSSAASPCRGEGMCSQPPEPPAEKPPLAEPRRGKLAAFACPGRRAGAASPRRAIGEASCKLRGTCLSGGSHVASFVCAWGGARQGEG